MSTCCGCYHILPIFVTAIKVNSIHSLKNNKKKKKILIQVNIIVDQQILKGWFSFMVFDAAVNNISVILWRRKVEYLKKTTDLPQVTDTLYHTMLDTSPRLRFELTTSVVIGIDCIGSHKSNYHTITATKAK